MPLYPYHCDHCGLDFEVSRPMSKATEPASCPMDGTAGTRIFTAPLRLTTKGQDAPPAAPAAAESAPTNQWSHFGHSHGGGIGGHIHGAPRRPPPTS